MPLSMYNMFSRKKNSNKSKQNV